MAKRIRVSSDDSTYYTLPGNTGEFRNEAGQLTDTIFGQTFQSNESGMISGTITANALYKGFAGYNVLIKKSGTSTSMTGEATSNVSGKIYQITDTAKQVIDPDEDIVVKDDGSAVSASNILRIDYLNGIVEFVSGYTVVGAVTFDANYLPLTEVAGSRNYTLTLNANAIDNSDIPTARANSGIRTYEPGLRTASLELVSTFKSANAFLAALKARNKLVVTVNPDGSSLSVAKGLFKYTNQGQSGNVGELEQENVTLNLYVPDNNDLFDAPLKWAHSSLTTLNQAIRKALEAWENETTIYAQYLYDGTNGFKGSAVVTDLTVTGGLEAMTEFAVGLQLTGATVAVP